MGDYAINLWDDMSVVTRDGEVIGTWGLIDGAIYTFTPTGSSEVMFIDPFVGPLCGEIQRWHEGNANQSWPRLRST